MEWNLENTSRYEITFSQSTSDGCAMQSIANQWLSTSLSAMRKSAFIVVNIDLVRHRAEMVHTAGENAG
jgi:hypothetical protein